MLKIVTVISNAVEKEFRKVKVLVLGTSDNRISKQVSPFGVDSSPIDGMSAIYAPTSKTGKDVIVGYYNKSLLAGKGETRLYSVNSDGELETFIWLTADGKIQLGGTDDNAVRFSDLKDGFDQLKGDLNDLISAFNAHTHATAGTGPPVPPTPGSGIPATPSSASVDSSKIEEILTP